MVKPKNYDSPFDREELEDLERSTIIESEQLQNIESFDNMNTYPPNGSYLNLPTSLWLASNVSPFTADEESEAYKKYKEIEGLE